MGIMAGGGASPSIGAPRVASVRDADDAGGASALPRQPSSAALGDIDLRGIRGPPSETPCVRSARWRRIRSAVSGRLGDDRQGERAARFSGLSEAQGAGAPTSGGSRATSMLPVRSAARSASHLRPTAADTGKGRARRGGGRRFAGKGATAAARGSAAGAAGAAVAPGSSDRGGVRGGSSCRHRRGG